MLRGSSIQLARVFGIRVGADPSWFVVLFFFIFVLSSNFRAVLGGADTQAYAAAVASALLLFGSVVVHELGHALVARRLGVEVLGIDLFFFGGFTRRSQDARSPGEEFKIAAAGPLMTLLVVAICVGTAFALKGSDGFARAALLGGSGKLSPTFLVLSFLGWMNVLLLAFNLIPALPLDGGRILRAAVWRRTGDQNRATRAAASLGRVLGAILLLGGLLVLGRGDTGDGVLLMVFGFFLGQNARAISLSAVVASRIDQVAVADIMDAHPVVLDADTTAAQAEELFAQHPSAWLPVVDPERRLLGLVRRTEVAAALSQGRPILRAAELLDDESDDLGVSDAATVDELIRSEPLRRLGALCATNAHGTLSGVVTLDHVRQAFQAAATRPSG